MSSYRLLALDMDGTLLTSDKRISPRTLQAMRVAAERGVHVALSTGRAVTELFEYRAQLRGVVRYGSLLSGGLVYDLDRDERIALRAFEPQLALRVVAQGLAEDAMVHVMTDAHSAATRRDVDRMHLLGQGVYQEMFRQQCTFVDDPAAFVRQQEGHVCKINLYHPSAEARERSRAALAGLPLQPVVGEAASLELTPAGVSKALGLELLCAHLGIGLEQCVAVGDAGNDVDALEAAGLAVAMGNATPEACAVADARVADNDHDGIVEVIERWF